MEEESETEKPQKKNKENQKLEDPPSVSESSIDFATNNDKEVEKSESTSYSQEFDSDLSSS